MGNWDIKPALYDNEVKNCLVATYGIQGLAEKHDFFGYLDVYFNYDSEENYQILDLQFEEYDPTAMVTDSSTDGDETEELIIAAGEPGIGVKNPRFQPKNYDIYTS